MVQRGVPGNTSPGGVLLRQLPCLRMARTQPLGSWRTHSGPNHLPLRFQRGRFPPTHDYHTAASPPTPPSTLTSDPLDPSGPAGAPLEPARPERSDRDRGREHGPQMSRRDRLARPTPSRAAGRGKDSRVGRADLRIQLAVRGHGHEFPQRQCDHGGSAPGRSCPSGGRRPDSIDSAAR